MGRAGRSGGSSSGGRSSIGGGSRSSGGRSSFSSGRSGGSSFGSSPSRSGSSSFGSLSKKTSSFGGSSFGSGSIGNGMSYRNKNIIINNSGNKYGSSGGGYNNSGNYHNNNSKGCLSKILISAVIIMAILIIIMILSGNSGITISTIEREALPKGSVTETEYFTDELGWINNKTELQTGLKFFYDKTGVQPYLYITDNVDGEHIYSTEELQPLVERLYGKLFADEAHLLLVFYEYDGEYAYRYMAGAQAKTVVDGEAADILMDYIDRYYYSDMSEEEMFSEAFGNAAIDMMKVYKSPWINAFMVTGVGIILIVVFVFWKSSKKQKNIEAEQTERILNTKLDEFGDSKIDELEDKYE